MALILSFAMLFPVAASGESALPAQPRNGPVPDLNEPFAGFSTRCRQRIVYRANANVSQAMIDRAGEELIVLAPFLMHPARRYERDYLAAHECAHHLFGDTKFEGLLARRTLAGEIARQELRADCWAAAFLAASGHRREAMRMIAIFEKRGQALAGGGYPSGEARAAQARRCMDGGLLSELDFPREQQEQD